MLQILRRARNYRYEFVAVADGAIVMMLEMIGSRYVAPYLGTSTYVWTAIIGVILGALAIGNYFGGRLADQEPSHRKLTLIILIAAGLLMLQLLLQAFVLEQISGTGIDLRIQAFLASLFIFAPAAAFMGMVSPYLAKLRLTSLEHAGQSVGRLYAAGTAGSILGTFLAGYWLIGLFGSRSLGWGLVILLILTTFLIDYRSYLWQRVVLVVLTLTLASLPISIARGGMTLLLDTDSAYARYQVYEAHNNDGTYRYLFTDNLGTQSAINLADPKTPSLDYTKRFIEAGEKFPVSPKDILMIGGGGMTVPAQLASRFPDARIDTVEIDPFLTDVAQKYFKYGSPKNVRIINQDGRYFLNHNTKKYDLIFMDAFSAFTPPFQLTTAETSKRLSVALKPSGVLVVNLVAIPSGDKTSYAHVSYATYDSVFPHVKWYQAYELSLAGARTNIMLLASRDGGRLAKLDDALKWPFLTQPPKDTSDSRLVLTDDFAPVEILTAREN